MKVFDVREKLAGSGEYILGAKETGSHACYLIYGVMGPGEKGRELKAGHGHEEIILALVGDLHLNGQQVDNRTGIEAVYVISGGHSGGGHHER